MTNTGKPTNPQVVNVESLVVASGDQLHRELGDETVILHPDHGTYFEVEGIGALIWELVQAPIVVCDICDRLLEEYEVERGPCEDDLLVFLTDLLEHALIEIDPEPAK